MAVCIINPFRYAAAGGGDACAISIDGASASGGSTFDCYADGNYDAGMTVAGTGIDVIEVAALSLGPFGEYFEDYENDSSGEWFEQSAMGPSATGFDFYAIGDGP